MKYLTIIQHYKKSFGVTHIVRKIFLSLKLKEKKLYWLSVGNICVGNAFFRNLNLNVDWCRHTHSSCHIYMALTCFFHGDWIKFDYASCYCFNKAESCSDTVKEIVGE